MNNLLFYELSLHICLSDDIPFIVLPKGSKALGEAVNCKTAAALLFIYYPPAHSQMYITGMEDDYTLDLKSVLNDNIQSLCTFLLTLSSLVNRPKNTDEEN